VTAGKERSLSSFQIGIWK